MASSFEKDFVDFLEAHGGNGHPLRANIFNHPRVKEVISQLDPSRIPTSPLDVHGAQSISQAIQAWRLYGHLCSAVVYSGRGYLNAILRKLPNAWHWALFLLPGEGNVRDLDEDRSERAEYPLEPDGTVAISTFVRYRMLMKTMVPLLNTPTGESACLAQPRFREVFLPVLTYDWPHPQEGHADLAEPLLRLMHRSRTFLAKNEHTDHWMYDILCHEKRHRGALIRAVFVRLRWHPDQRLPYNDLFKS